MMDWIRRYQTEIGFFIAGWCALAALTDFAKGDYLWTVINGALVYINIKLAK
jgi:hypothetical protein